MVICILPLTIIHHKLPHCARMRRRYGLVNRTLTSGDCQSDMTQDDTSSRNLITGNPDIRKADNSKLHEVSENRQAFLRGTRQIAKALGFPHRSVARWIDLGLLPVVRVGRITIMCREFVNPHLLALAQVSAQRPGRSPGCRPVGISTSERSLDGISTPGGEGVCALAAGHGRIPTPDKKNRAKG